MTRPARALIDARALHRNLVQAKKLASHSKVMAVVKANGYGHGLAWTANVLREADAFGVAGMEEGVELRRSGVSQPVCLLEGFFEPGELGLLSEHGLSTVLHSEDQLQHLESTRVQKKPDVWVKIDTGMHRLGFEPEQLPEIMKRLDACASAGRIRLMSHLACADDRADPATRAQSARFRALTSSYGLDRSLANSAGIAAWPDTHYDWVRPGIMLYGVSPLLDARGAELGLEPVMTLETALIAVSRRRKGEAVGYGGAWTCPEDMPVGVAAIGYGDGYPRHAPAGTPVLVNGKRAPLIGRVSMDMITLDLRGRPEAKTGDRVVLWGRGLPVEEVAEHAGTIGYELLCRVAERIPRVEA